MIGERLMELRKDADLTQDELAKILKINKHSISSFERDKSEPPDDIKVAIAKYFNVSVDYLLGVTDLPTPIEAKTMTLRLPSSFRQENIPVLNEFIDFLQYQAKHKP